MNTGGRSRTYFSTVLRDSPVARAIARRLSPYCQRRTTSITCMR